MKSDNPAKHFAIAFVLAVVIYVVAYWGIEHRRTQKGPWEVTFAVGSSNAPTLIVTQPALGLANVQLAFPGQPAPANLPVQLSFRDPKPVPYDLPIGKCVFMDTTFLPGTLTLQVFGHEIEFLPRVIMIDHLEHAWQSGEVIVLQATNTSPNWKL